MTDSRRIRLVSSQAEPARGAKDRYRVVVSNADDCDVTVRVYDLKGRRIVGSWRGELARRLMDSDVLGYSCLSCPVEECDKRSVRELMLVAAGIQMELERCPLAGKKSDPLGIRLRELRLSLPAFHERIAALVFGLPGQHLSDNDVHCLTQFRYPSIDDEKTATVLDDLVRWRVLQRVCAGENGVFYDTDTRPHLHVYCARSGELRDAPASGVLQVVG